jgi:hypothetical protein
VEGTENNIHIYIYISIHIYISIYIYNILSYSLPTDLCPHSGYRTYATGGIDLCSKARLHKFAVQNISVVFEAAR